MPVKVTSTEDSGDPFFEMDFEALDLDFIEEKSFLVRVWHISLGISAFFDFSAAMLDRYLLPARYEMQTDEQLYEDFTEEAPDDVFEYIAYWLRDNKSSITSAVYWLQENSTNLALIFALLWFIDAFVKAHRQRVLASLELEKKELLDDRTAKEVSWWKGPVAVHYRTVVIQLLLLPVGFYVYCYTGYRRLLDPDRHDEVIEIIHRTDNDAIPDEYEIFDKHASLSLAFAVLKHLAITISRRTGVNVKRFGMARAKALAWTIIFHAVRHPLKFARQLRKTLRAIRWMKYLAPLLGAANKLKGNLTDLARKYRQQRAATKVRAVRQKLWDVLTTDELREYCAILIQKTFRAHQTRKRVRALQLLRGQKEYLAAVKLEACFRGLIQRARFRLMRKREELRRLREREQELRQKHDLKSMDASERRDMYRLTEELNEEAKELLNKQLLLRPNTAFSVAWKMLFVLAVIFEISQIALKPVLKKYRDPATGEPLDFERFMDHKLVPIPVSELAECSRETLEKKRSRLNHMLSRIARRPKEEKQSEKKELPWYCGSVYSTTQAVYIKVLQLWILEFLVIVGIICYLDVFVNFFTGEFDKDTGVLKPKPFVVRWIVPGLLLQLLVNPTMAETSELVLKILAGVIQHGPLRVFRWAQSLFIPLFLLIRRGIRRRWRRTVAYQNRMSQAPSLVS